MEKDYKKLQTHIGRSKLTIFVIVGFLAVITYLLITISDQLQSSALTTSSEASYRDGLESTIRMGDGTMSGDTIMMDDIGVEGNQPLFTLVTADMYPEDSNPNLIGDPNLPFVEEEPSKCPAKPGVRWGPYAISGPTECKAVCGDGTTKNAARKAGGWTEEQCNLEAQRLCGCIGQECQAVVDWSNKTEFGQTCSNGMGAVNKITCTNTGISTSYEGYACYKKGFIQELANAECCQEDAFSGIMDKNQCAVAWAPYSSRISGVKPHGTKIKVSCKQYALKTGGECSCDVDEAGHYVCCVK